ncbi:amidase family protein [Streptomyces radicis]|uniref:Amidase n=1 Tax=Streptomyces radicis TaxID=1750517 RepID=A0A3A9WYK1_9ACTN|nr:amidase family protein [Streptomyces radicis]RKN12886.1 amidase [Streptomyces radicis]RKN27349.1 amidase [Streptomyces radicis]
MNADATAERKDASTIPVAAARRLLASGGSSSLALAHHALRRVAALDRGGPRLRAMPVLDPAVHGEAARRDAERADGRVRGPLHGVPFAVKDSFAVRGLTVAAGSPAFAGLRAERDAVVVERLRAAGALLIGRTNMPPMAIGGGQAGLYGRTRSPYNPDFLAAAWHSGSSIGSAVSVAAGFCSFGIGEETVSSGRSPASNNALVAYTPSWGVVPGAGNWPLHPFRDVVVPHTLDVADLLDVLAVIAGPDDRDVWQRQTAIDVSPAARVAADIAALAAGSATGSDLRGLRVGVPRLYVGEGYDDVAPIPLRPSIRALWDDAERAIADAGATVVRVPFPLVEAYESRSARAPDLVTSGYLPGDWTAYELGPLMTAAWTAFLDDHCGGAVALRDIAPTGVRPDVPYAIDAIAGGRSHPGRDVFDFAAILRAEPPSMAEAIARAAPALRGLVAARERLFDAWLAEARLDVLAFPANADIGPWDAETNPDSARLAWADGAVFSHMNHVMRRVGLPSVTVPMGRTADLGMPVGLTLCGPAYTDADLLRWAAAVERALPPRPAAPLPEVPPHGLYRSGARGRRADPAPLAVDARAEIAPGGAVGVTATVRGGVASALLEVAGHRVEARPDDPVEITLDPALRRAHGDASVLVLAGTRASDGLMAAAALAEAPFRWPTAEPPPTPPPPPPPPNSRADAQTRRTA